MSNRNDRSSRSMRRIAFNIPVDMETVEETLLLAILVVGCLYGDAAVRLDAGYAMDAPARIVVVRDGTVIARAVAQVFVGLCAHEYGESAFTISRADPAASRGTVPESARREAV